MASGDMVYQHGSSGPVGPFNYGRPYWYVDPTPPMPLQSVYAPITVVIQSADAAKLLQELEALAEKWRDEREANEPVDTIEVGDFVIVVLGDLRRRGTVIEIEPKSKSPYQVLFTDLQYGTEWFFRACLEIDPNGDQ